MAAADNSRRLTIGRDFIGSLEEASKRSMDSAIGDKASPIAIG